MKTYYWHDALHDDFSKVNIKQKKIPLDYKYSSRNPIFLFFESLLRLFAFIILTIVVRFGFLIRVKNKKVLKEAKKKGYYIYGNHTNYLLDAYMPYLVALPRKTHTIVSPDAVSITGLKTIVKMLGGTPIPTSLKGMRNFRGAVDKAVKYKRVVAIYPEAHIWPYYTDIRPFGKESFHYPIDSNSPSFAFTNIYQKRKLKFVKVPKITTYIDGPFYPDLNLDRKEQYQKLRDDIYNAMKRRVDENPKYDYCKYIYVEDKNMTNAKR